MEKKYTYLSEILEENYNKKITKATFNDNHLLITFEDCYNYPLIYSFEVTEDNIVDVLYCIRDIKFMKYEDNDMEKITNNKKVMSKIKNILLSSTAVSALFAGFSGYFFYTNFAIVPTLIISSLAAVSTLTTASMFVSFINASIIKNNSEKAYENNYAKYLEIKNINDNLLKELIPLIELSMHKFDEQRFLEGRNTTLTKNPEYYRPIKETNTTLEVLPTPYIRQRKNH